MTQDEVIIKKQATVCLGMLGRNVLWSLGDLMNEGQICLNRAQRGWRPDGGANFSTYFTRVLINHFRGIVHKALKCKPTANLAMDPQDEPSAVWVDRETGKLRFRLRHFALSDDAEEFLRLAFAPPSPLKEEFRNSKNLPMSEVIRDWLGWSRDKLTDVESELHAVIIS